MEPGYVADATGQGRNTISKWTEGAPHSTEVVGANLSWFTTSQGETASASIEIATYRCRNCGFLESYAY